MKLAASRQILSHPKAIALWAADELLVLMSSGEQSRVYAFNQDLFPTWNHALREPAFAIIASGGICWILDQSGAKALGARGECVAHVPLNPHEGLRAASFAVVDDGLIIAWEHHRTARMTLPIVERITFQGRLVWSTVLPLGTVAYEGVVEMHADSGWMQRPKPARIPETWFSNIPVLPVSGELILLSFSEMPRSGIGMAYALSLTDGTVRFMTKQGPIDEVTPIGDGVFLAGYQGYGAFETLQYGVNGQVENRWASHGYCVPEDDGIRVIEMENTLPSKSRLARLGPAGQIEKGAHLPEYYTSRPYRQPDGMLIFLRGGAVNVARGLQVIESMMLSEANRSFYSPAVGMGGAVFCAQSGVGPSRQTVLIRIDL